jgi:hypothetical protein
MELEATCPYCGEAISFVIDEGGGEKQRYVEDCEVCCRPIDVRVRADEDNEDYVLDVRRADE